MQKAENELSSYSGILSAFAGKGTGKNRRDRQEPTKKVEEEPRGDPQIRKLSGYEWAGIFFFFITLKPRVE